MIENHGDFEIPYFVLYCDRCGAEANEAFDEWDDVLDWKQNDGKQMGWTSVKEKGEWEDRCPACNPFRNASSENRKPIKRSKS